MYFFIRLVSLFMVFGSRMASVVDTDNFFGLDEGDGDRPFVESDA